MNKLKGGNVMTRKTENKDTALDYKIQRLKMLPFVADINNGKKKERTFWKVKPSADYIIDCNTGRGYAALTLAYMKEFHDPTLLTQCVMAMHNNKSDKGIKVGFFEFIAGIALTSNIDPIIEAANQQKRSHELLKSFFED